MCVRYAEQRAGDLFFTMAVDAARLARMNDIPTPKATMEFLLRNSKSEDEYRLTSLIAAGIHEAWVYDALLCRRAPKGNE